MRVTLHDYRSDPSLMQKDGVNLAHENIATLLRSTNCADLDVDFHDFNRLLRDATYARRVLSDADCVVSNVGPHAHYYFFLREQYGLDFRIVRDVRTAIWSSYLHQEHLLQPFLRGFDVLMVASNFTRGIYEKMFPHLRRFRTIICYPLTIAFPKELQRRRSPGQDDDSFTLGYIGRLSNDKNFPDIIELLICLNQRRDRRYRLLACGDIHSPGCHPEIVRSRLRRTLGDDSYFEYLSAQKNSDIWKIYNRFDAMVFPSTSNLETLGRVLIEASYAGVPVICGEHAAAPELMPESSLCRVVYAQNKRFCCHSDHALGRISIPDMVRALTGGSLASPVCHIEYQSHPARFLQELLQGKKLPKRADTPVNLTSHQENFIERIAIDLPKPLERTEADALIAASIPWFLGLQSRDEGQRRQWLDRLLRISKRLERTQRFIRKTASTKGDFTDVGGIDIELCHVTGFYPHFHIGENRSSLYPEVVAG